MTVNTKKLGKILLDPEFRSVVSKTKILQDFFKELKAFSVRNIISRIKSVYPEFTYEEHAVFEKAPDMHSHPSTEKLDHILLNPEFRSVVNKTKILQDFLKELKMWPLPIRWESPEAVRRVANNILDFLLDPTRIPVRNRLYFRPEEVLKNEIYERAKAEARQLYGDQRYNSDFYPKQSRTKTQMEAGIMDRRSLIASLDILSKNFKDPSDPIARDLRAMAVALSRMDESELRSRLASEAPNLEEGLRISTEHEAAISLAPGQVGEKPPFGRGMHLPGGWQSPAEGKGKALPQSEVERRLKQVVEQFITEPPKGLLDSLAKLIPSLVRTSTEHEAAIPLAPGQVGEKPPFGRGMHLPGGWQSPAEGKGKALPQSEVERRLKQVVEQFITEPPKGLLDSLAKLIPSLAKTAELQTEEETYAYDFWSKEASNLIAKSLVAELGVVAEDGTKEDEELKSKEKDETADKKEKKPKEKEVTSGKIKGPGVPDGTGPGKDSPSCPFSDKKKETKETKEGMENSSKKIVNTDVLASVNFEGIEMEPNIITSESDIISEEDKARLSKLFE